MTELENQALILQDWIRYFYYNESPQYVRAQIRDSWKRCKEQFNLCPWGSPYDRNISSLDLLKRRRAECSDMVSYAIPVIVSVVSVIDSLSFRLRDPQCVTLYSLDSTDYRILGDSSGMIMKEENMGTHSTPLCLRYQDYVEVIGYENFFVRYFHTMRAATPICDAAGNIVGILDVMHSGHSEKYHRILPIIKIMAKIISQSIAENNDMVESGDDFASLLEVATDAVCCTDNRGVILNCNQACTALFGLKQPLHMRSNLMQFVGLNTMTPIFASVHQRIYFESTLIKSGKPCFFTVTRNNKSYGQETLIFRFHQQPQDHDSTTVVPIENFTRHIRSGDTHGMIGISPAMDATRAVIDKVAPTMANVLIVGETGTGKDLVAQALHRASGFKGEYVALNCGAVAPSLLHSELFGYAPGSFTGANKGGRIGKIEQAENGTLFLDEVGEMPLDMQISLLRFLQDYTILPIGSNKTRMVKVRIVAATNRNLLDRIAEGTFRQDLYYRLNVVKIDMPPLRERREDIPLLAEHFLLQSRLKYGQTADHFDPDALDVLKHYNWPGNIRELQNCIERAVLFFGKSESINKEMLSRSIEQEGETSSCRMTLRDVENNYIMSTLESCGGNIKSAAKILGISRPTLYRKLRELQDAPGAI